MKHTVTVTKEIEVTHLHAEMGVRYWEDAVVNGEEEDNDAPKMPFADGEVWRITIDLATGAIRNWPQGVSAETHYKVCDNGVYSLLVGDDVVVEKSGYVPDMLAPSGGGYGDYVILSIGHDGVIANWKANPHYFGEEE